MSLTVKTTRWFRALFLAAGMCFVGGGTAAFVASGDATVRWMTLLVLGGGGLACLWVALSSGRRLTLDGEGIRGRPFGLVRWADVTEVFVRRNGLNRVLGLNVREPSRYHERLPRWRRALWKLSQRAGFGDLSFDITGLDVGSDGLVKIVRGHVQEAER